MKFLFAIPVIAAVMATGLSAPAAGATETPETTWAQFSDSDVTAAQLAKARAKRGKSKASDVVVINKPAPSDRVRDQASSGPAVIPDPTGPTTGETMPAPDGGFTGVSYADTAGFGWGYYPPDTDGDIGINHYVQIVNAAVGIFDRDGNVLAKFPTYDLFGGMSNACATDNSGDGIVQYDQFADRWLISQFAVESGSPYYECIAISKTPDPTGAYYRYAFAYNEFPDYPKIGVWPDGYYVTYNMYGPTFESKFCAWERDRMLIGASARQVCFNRSEEFSLLPSDVDGPNPPPVGAPNYLVGESWASDEELVMYKFAVNWVNTSSSSLTGPIAISVNRFNWACTGSNDRLPCVPQPGTSQMLDAVGGRMMYRLAYRNDGGVESLVANHTVAMDEQLLPDQLGVGWYELRDLDQPAPTVHQQGTTADPDGTTSRWMASLAKDGDGNIALGYSRGGSTVAPGIALTGRLAADPLNQMTQTEQVVGPITGGVQTGTAARWGDYTSMQIDPVDDCTFWYTNQYMAPGQTDRSWRTWVTNFAYPGCDHKPAAPSAPPTGVSAVAGDASASVSWTAPSISEPIVGYEVTSVPGGKKCWTWTTSCVVPGLTNGDLYSFTVQTYNVAGSSSASDPSNTVKPVGKPSAPTSVKAVAGQRTATISWGAANPNGLPLLGYTVTSVPATAGCTTTGLSCTVSGLTYGVSYTFTVYAANSLGAGAGASAAPVVSRFVGDPAITVSPAVVKPGRKVTIALSGSNAACQATFTLGSSSKTLQVGSGSVSTTIVAPKPNKKYPVTATQGGNACVTKTVTSSVRVKGPWIDGPNKAKKGATKKFIAKEFRKRKNLTWRVLRNGKLVKKVTKKTTSKGRSTLKYKFRKKGTYTIKAKQKGRSAKISVKV